MAETLISAASCRRLMPSLECELYATSELVTSLSGAETELFTRLVTLESLLHPKRPRFEAIQYTELDQVLFMDGDTLFLRPVPELFNTLSLVDVAVAPSFQWLHSRGVSMGVYKLLPDTPITFPEWNTGVLAVRMSDRFRAFAQEWSRWYGLCRRNGYAMDQAAFRSTLAHSDLRVHNLPTNWNFRAEKTQFVNGIVRIIHAHGELAQIGEPLNADHRYRLYEPDPLLIHGKKPKTLQREEKP